jgi:magnesium chelatase family protein
MLARRFPGIMPPMSRQESLEVTRVYSVAGLLDERATLIEDRPFRSPHHHVSLAGLIGGGTGMARPGEVSFAHRGVLFLDELPLYRRDVLESLRAPLEEGIVRIARSGGVITYPCSFSLIAALNPCPCGYSTDSARECRCSPQRLHAYRSKLSGPLIDRMDLQVDLKRLSRDELLGSPQGETSAAIRARIESARAIQKDRYKAEGVTNATASKGELEAGVQLSPRARSMLGDAIDNMFLTGRGLNRVLRIARTIADLGGESSVDEGHVGAALAMRLLDPLSEVAA